MGNNDFVLFYAWQDDTAKNIGRNFIENTTSKALKQLQNTLDLYSAIRLDKDTKDTPGMPDIVSTILGKIRASSAFLADITFIGKSIQNNNKWINFFYNILHVLPYNNKGKCLPNPNVMFELGYAVNVLGWERIICVINTYYGDVSDLPFDLQFGRRWPIQFYLPPDVSGDKKKEVKEKLINDLKVAIESITKLPPREYPSNIEKRIERLENISTVPSGLIPQIQNIHTIVDNLQSVIIRNENEQNNPKRLAQESLDNLVLRIKNKDFEALEYVQGMLGLVVLPATQIPNTLELFTKETQIRLKLIPLYASGWDHRRYGERFVTFNKSDKKIDAVSEISQKAVISAAGHNVISIDRTYYSVKNISEDIHIIPSIAFEQNIIEAVCSYINLLVEFNIAGPWIVAFTLFNLKKSILAVDIELSRYGKYFSGEAITPPPIVLTDDKDIDSFQNIAKFLRPSFDFIWREHNFPQSANYNSVGIWIGGR